MPLLRGVAEDLARADGQQGGGEEGRGGGREEEGEGAGGGGVVCGGCCGVWEGGEAEGGLVF